MRKIVDAWLARPDTQAFLEAHRHNERTSHPDIQSLFDRAHQYWYDTYVETGSPPDRFLVTEEEYRLLKLVTADENMIQAEWCLANDEMRIFGMRVCRPARLPWHRDNRYMQHIRPFGPIHLTDSFTLALHALEPCRTERPLMPQRDVTCPCGEVIWDLSTCQWTEVYTLADMQMSYDIAMPAAEQTVFMMIQYGQAVTARMERAFVHACQPRVPDPLPPIDDLDEGLQCCGRPYPTFAEFIAHRRKHGEG